jgi:hypothetical protein
LPGTAAKVQVLKSALFCLRHPIPKLPKPPSCIIPKLERHEYNLRLSGPLSVNHLLPPHNSSHVVQTITAPRRADRRSPAERHPHPDPDLRFSRFWRQDQAPSRRLWPRRHLRHCSGTISEFLSAQYATYYNPPPPSPNRHRSFPSNRLPFSLCTCQNPSQPLRDGSRPKLTSPPPAVYGSSQDLHP